MTAQVNGLKEDAEESARNLQDTLKTNDGLASENDKLRVQISGLERALHGKDTQTNALLEEHNLLVHKNKEREEVIASLMRDLEQCEYIKYKCFMYVAYA